ncbi:MAG: hypothetical protein ACRDO1_02330 [Nocardioidaceae bacterium]
MRPADLGRLASALASGPVRAALVTFLLVWLVALAWSTRIERSYESHAVVAFQPRDPATTGAETMTLVTPKYVEVLRSPAVIDDAAHQLGEDPTDVRTAAKGVFEPNTLNLRVQVTATNGERAARIANTLTAGVVQEAADDALVAADVVSWAVAPTTAATPTPAQVRLLGLLVGLAAAASAGVGVARHLSHRRGRTLTPGT